MSLTAKVRRTPTSLLRYEADVATGYEPGTALAEWKARQVQEGDGA